MTERQGKPATPEFREWFEERLKELHRIAQKIVKLGEPHVPVLMCYENGGRVGMIQLTLDNLEEKERAFAMQRFVANMNFIDGVIFVVESWIKVTDNPKTHDLGQRSIADDPARQEAIMFNCLRGPMQLIAYCKITRPDNKLEDPVVIDPLADRELSHGRMIYNKPTEH